MMSETETNIEIEDVLASIRRLVSSDVNLSRSAAVPHRSAAAVAMPLRAPEPEPEMPEPEVEAELAPAPEPVSEPEGMAEAEAAPADDLEPVPEPDLDQAVETALSDAVSDMVAAPETPLEDDLSAEAPLVLEAASTAPEAQVDDAFDPMPEADTLEVTPVFAEEPAEPVAETVPEPVAEAGVGDACLVLGPALRIDEAEAAEAVEEEMPETGLAEPEPMAEDTPVMAEVEAAPEPRVLTEAEALLAEAEAALEGSGALLEASSALDEAAQEPPEMPELVSEPSAKDDLGDELTRLESTIAELEAAVAESDTEFEPEEGHPFVAEGAAPLTELPESFDEAALNAGDCAIEAALEPEFEDAPDLSEEAADAAFAAEQHDPDLEDAAWAENETGGVGMDWAEATLNLARGAAPRRLSLEDAEEAEQHVAARRSTYDSLREELDDDTGYYDAELVESDAEFASDERLLDEAALRDMVGQMVRDELRGALGERITQNVRKLVRREIQRALMGQGYE